VADSIVDEAVSAGWRRIGMTGSRPSPTRHRCDIVLDMPSAETSKFQEGHLVAGHILRDTVEKAIFGQTS
jgi:D-sedoheptulose 7-phosphate isomerase